MPSSQRPHRRSVNSSKSNLPAGMVRERLSGDPQWQHYTNDGRWICPYCLKDLRAPRSGKSGLVHHIESHLGSRCSSFKNGEGQVQSEQAIYDRLLSLYIEDQARSNPAWQVFDHEGYWYSPSSLQRIPSVRIVNGRFDSFTVQQMVTHLKSCPHFAKGTQYGADQVQQARDNGIRASSLAVNLQRVVNQRVWQFYLPQGWLCPYCTSVVPEVQQGANPGNLLHAMASHLLERCSVYPQDQRGIKSEEQLQQIVQQSHSAGTAAPPVSPSPAAPEAVIASPINNTPVPTASPVGNTSIPTATPVPGTGQQQNTTGRQPLNDSSGQRIAPTPATQHNLNTLPETRQTHGKSGGYSTISDDLDGIVSAGFDDDDDDGLPSGGTNDWVTSTSRKNKLPRLNSGELSVPGDALESKTSEPPAREVPVAAPVSESQQIEEKLEDPPSEDAFSWMDDEMAASGTGEQHDTGEANTDLIRAQGLQKNLMNECPKIPGFTFATRYEACSTVSGDFYEFIEKDDGNIIFAEGDVSGHGVEAGLIMSMARKCLTIFARQGGTPAEVVSSMNEALVDDLKGEKFITMCYGELNPQERIITWIRSGHNPILRYNKNTKEFSEIKPGGMVVGMKSGKLFRQLLQEEATQVVSGDVFLIYTDGFNETMNRQGEEYGFERMRHVIVDKAEHGIEDMLDHLMNSIRQFRGSAPADDDLTLLAIEVD